MEDVATSVEARNKSLVRDRFDAWAQGNGSPFELLADNASWTIEGGSVASKTYVGPRDLHARGDQAFQCTHERGPQAHDTRAARTEIVVIFFDASGTARDGKPYVGFMNVVHKMKAPVNQEE
jgi:uncharacterized protein